MANAKRKCCGCKDRFPAESMIKQPVGYFHSFSCSIEYAGRKTAAKVKKEINNEKKQNAKQKRDFKANDVSRQKGLTQTVFNRLRKLQELKWFRDRGQEPECISCGKTNMDWCCGHFKTVASSGALRFSANNTYLQCNRYCNKGKSGNIEGCKNTRGYKKGLVERFGKDKGLMRIEWLEENQRNIKRWTGAELVEMRKEFNEQIRELESEH